MGTLPTTPRILLAQAEPEVQPLLAMALQWEGYTIEAVSTMDAALRQVEEQLYDLILTDLLTTTPPRSGDTTHLQGIRRLCQACHPTPVALLTTWPIDLHAAEHTGVAFALHLPEDLDAILRRIADRLNAPLYPRTGAEGAAAPALPGGGR